MVSRGTRGSGARVVRPERPFNASADVSPTFDQLASTLLAAIRAGLLLVSKSPEREDD